MVSYQSPSAIEYARLEDQATSLALMMHNSFIHAPLSSHTRLLDIGCGTGTVTRQLGFTYPNASIYGIDLSPVPPAQENPPANVEYILGDFRQLVRSNDLRLAPGSTDFVFSRLLVLGMTDWPGYLRDIASLLRPGGWAELQDFSLEWYLHGTLISGQWPWMRALSSAAERKGWDLNCGRNIKAYMSAAGLRDIEVKEYRLPMGDWLSGKKPGTKRIGEHAAREYGWLYYHAVPKMVQGMGFAEEEVEGWREMCMRDLRGREGLELRFFATVGRKPEG